MRVANLLSMAAVAFAAALLATSLTGDARAAVIIETTEGGPVETSRLESLTVEIVLTGSHAKYAQVIERRYYLTQLPQSYEGPFTATFQHSLPADATLGGLEVNGVEQTPQRLQERDAETARRALVKALGDPAPLRELGYDLIVGEPLTMVDYPEPVEVVLTYGLDMDPHGTMYGLELPVDWDRRNVGSLSITVDDDVKTPARFLYGAYQDLTETETGASHYGYGAPTDRPIVILSAPSKDPVQLDVLPFRYSDAEPGSFMAFLSAKEQTEQQAMPRDIVLAIDRSGSMEGEKLAQAKTAFTGVLDALNPEDTFAVVTFAGTISTVFQAAVPATPEHIDQAKSFVAEIIADGGTNISGALDESFDALPTQPGVPRYVVLLTDGQPTEGEESVDGIVDLVRTWNEVGARLFSFGVGHDVNTTLLEKLAKETSGEAFYIQPGFSVDTAIASFFEQIQAPALTDPQLDLSAFGVSDRYPESLPDIFSGQAVTLLGRYSKPGTATVALSGYAGGELTGYAFELSMPAYDVREGYVPGVWATRHVGTLLHQVKLVGAEPAIIEEALATAERYGVVTPFTHYVPDDLGNSTMSYSDVPRDEVGSQAVQTSAALDEFENGTSASTGTGPDVRYHRDRVLPLTEGAYHDSTLPDAPQWVDVHFASDAFFELASAEAEHGMAGFLAVGTQVRFELLGRHIRVTDPALVPEGGSLPSEVSVVPAPLTPDPGPAVGADFVSPLSGEEVTPLRQERGGQATDGCAGGGASTAFWLFGLVPLWLVRRRRQARDQYFV